jgi:hypothetical protein
VTAKSLVAFGLAFLAATLTWSLLLGLGLRVAERRLRALGAWSERRAATLALVLPPLLGLALVAVLALDSAWALWSGRDHCLVHPHHLHLCLRHGAEWAYRPWAMAIVVALSVYLAVRLAQVGWAHLEAQRSVWRLQRLGTPLPGVRRCFLVPLDGPVVFTAGLFTPAIIIAQGAWDRLDPEERQAVLEHELAHLAHGDLWRRALLGVTACLAAPGFGGPALRLWEASAERVCDHRAARRVGRPSVVARAIVTLARGSSTRGAPAGAVFAAACRVTERVVALLDQAPVGLQPASRLSWLAGLACLSFAAGCTVVSAPLHHLIETILG